MALRELLAKFGVEVDTKGLEKGKAKVEGFKEQLEKLGKAFAAGLIVAEIKEFVSALVEQGSALVDTAAQLGIVTEDLQRWTYAAGLSGAAAEDLAAGFKFLQKNAVDAKEGGAETSAAFKKLGVDFKDAEGNIRDTPELLKEVGIAISKIDDPAQRTALSLKLLGKGGLKLGPMFEGGADAINKTLDEFDALGGGLGNDALKILDDIGDNSDKLKLSFTSLKSQIVVALFPAISKGIERFIRWSNGFRNLIKNTNALKATIVVFGAIAVQVAARMLAAYAPLIIRFALMAAAVALAVLAVDELITTFKGGDTVISRVIDKLFGVGATADAVKYLHKEYDDFFTTLGKFGEMPWDLWIIRLGKGIGTFIDKDLPEFFSLLASDTKKWLTKAADSAGQAAHDIGSNIVKGIVDGLTGAKDTLIDSITDIGAKLLGALKKTLGINSPSALTAEMGMYLDIGLVNGLAKGAPKVAAATKEHLTDPVTASVETAEAYGAAYVPSVTSNSRSVSNTNHVDNRPQITQYITGTKDAAEGAARGARQALSEDRRALVAALEPLGGE